MKKNINTLTFVESEDRYSVYRDRDGNPVFLEHDTRKRLVPLETINLFTLWAAFLKPRIWRVGGNASHYSDFCDLLKAMTIDSEEEVDEQVMFCGECSSPEWSENAVWTGHEEYVCGSCIENYWACADCGEQYRSTTTTLSDTEICSHCLEKSWTYCEECDGYRHDEDDSHRHDASADCCTAPAQDFTIRNDGEPALHNDTRVTISLPAGEISEEGIEAIGYYLRSENGYYYGQPEYHAFWNLSLDLEGLGMKWQTKRGNYTKRLSRLAYSEHQLKIPPRMLSQIGCIARDHSTSDYSTYEIEVTRDLNQSASDFGNDDSCWWTTHYLSRCTFKSNGGFGLRTFSGHGRGWVNGRAWVLPLKKDDETGLTPTFETQEPDAFMVFNGYGDMEGYTPARILSHMVGMTYRKIEFRADPMYVNEVDDRPSAGYLVAPEEIVGQFAEDGLHLDLDTHSNLFSNEASQANQANQAALFEINTTEVLANA